MKKNYGQRLISVRSYQKLCSQSKESSQSTETYVLNQKKVNSGMYINSDKKKWGSIYMSINATTKNVFTSTKKKQLYSHGHQSNMGV